jgi:hypothetical protein
LVLLFGIAVWYCCLVLLFGIAVWYCCLVLLFGIDVSLSVYTRRSYRQSALLSSSGYTNSMEQSSF